MITVSENRFARLRHGHEITVHLQFSQRNKRILGRVGFLEPVVDGFSRKRVDCEVLSAEGASYIKNKRLQPCISVTLQLARRKVVEKPKVIETPKAEPVKVNAKMHVKYTVTFKWHNFLTSERIPMKEGLEQLVSGDYFKVLFSREDCPLECAVLQCVRVDKAEMDKGMTSDVIHFKPIEFVKRRVLDEFKDLL